MEYRETWSCDVEEDDDETCTPCPECGFMVDGDALQCSNCGNAGSCPDCGSLIGFDGSVCVRCFYHVPEWVEERWMDRVPILFRNVGPRLRRLLHNLTHRPDPNDLPELPF